MVKNNPKISKSVKRRISAVMAAVVAVTTVASVTYLHSREVEAKDTLDSINQLMKQVNKDQPYSILEIVPDDVSFTVSVNN